MVDLLFREVGFLIGLASPALEKPEETIRMHY
jgi:hypothetical protein